MDEKQTIFNILILAVGGLGGWWMKMMWDSLKELERADRSLIDRVAAIDVLVAGSYVKRDYFESKLDGVTTALFAKLDRIELKLDGKVDKGH
mgnify:CR=1 FL=1